MPFGYSSSISINAAQVPTTQTDFPVLVSVTDARFKTVGNSGHVQNSSGFDIRPYSDAALINAITGYELERYNASSGEVIMWVKVSSLTSSSTPIYLAYGDSSLTTDGSSTTTWSNSFLGVWHLNDGTTLNVNSSTGSNNGTNSGSPLVSAAAGMIDGAGNFHNNDSFITVGALIKPTAATISGWVNGTSFPNAYNTLISRDTTNDSCMMYVKSTGKLACFAQNGASSSSYDGTGSHTLSAATWYYLTMTYSNAAGLIGYVNASSDGTATGGFDLKTSGVPPTEIGQDDLNGGRNWNGLIDEARVASVARSADWITTEYNNQFAPGTFETLGTEITLGQAAGLYTK